MHQIGAKINFEGEYEFVLPGYNLRPTEIQAAIGLSQLPGLDLAQLYRKANWATFKDAFCNHPHFSTQQSPHGQAVPFGFVLVADSAERRAAALLAMNTAGIECRMVTGGCITRHPVIEQYDHEAVNGLPVANHVHDCGFFVGNQPRDLSAEIELLYSTLKEI